MYKTYQIFENSREFFKIVTKYDKNYFKVEMDLNLEELTRNHKL